jgi:hypothetical protein
LRQNLAQGAAAWWQTGQIPQDFEGFARAAKKMRRLRKSLLRSWAQVRKYPSTEAANTATARRMRRKALKANENWRSIWPDALRDGATGLVLSSCSLTTRFY